MPVNKRLKHPTTCQCCNKWLKTGLFVYKWWPGPEERGVYPTVWTCTTCWRELVAGERKPRPLRELVAETRAALESLKPEPVEVIELPTGVVPPSRKSPMSERR